MKEKYTKPEAFTPEDGQHVIFFEPPRMPFGRKIFIYCVVWIVITFLSCCASWILLDKYEESLPRTALEEYIYSTKHEVFFSATSYAMPGRDNLYESAFDVANKLTDVYTGTMTYAKIEAESSEDMPVYLVQHDGEDLFKITLEKRDSNVISIFPGYTVKQTEFVKNDVIVPASYRLIFPKNAYMFINGHRLQKNISECFEMFYSYGSDLYRGIVLENFVTVPEITSQRLNSDGTTTKLACELIGDYYMVIDSETPLYEVTITAPEDAVVRISDRRVTELFITDTYVHTIDGTDTQVNMVVYTVPTVHGEAIVTATIDDETELTVTQDDTGTVFTVLPE